ITITGQSITSTAGRLDITLLGAGGDTGMLKVQNSILNSNGGNITLDQLNRTTTGADGSSLNSPYAMTAVVLNSTLNTSPSANKGIGNIIINGDNMSASGNTNLTAGGNISVSMNTSQQNVNAIHFSDTTVKASGNISLSSMSSPDSLSALFFEGNNTTLLSTDGNIFLDATSGTKKNQILKVNGGLLKADKGNVSINITVPSSPWEITEIRNLRVEAENINVRETGRSEALSLTDGVSLGAGNVFNATNSVSIYADTGLAPGSIVVTGSDIDLSGNSINLNNTSLNATTGNVTLKLNDGANGVISGSATLKSGLDICISADSTGLNGVLRMSSSELTANRNIHISGTPLKGSNSQDTVAINNSRLKAGQINISAGVGDSGNLHNGVSILNSTLDADAVDVSGVTRNNNKAGVLLSCATVNATDINISGSALGNGAGVQLSNITLNGDKASIKAVSEDSTGFNISNITRQGGLSDIANLTLSSAGSLPSTVNIIGAGVMSTDEFDNDISKRKLGSVTQVDSGFLKGNNKTYTDGLTLSAAEGTDGWLYSGVNITVTGGDTILNNIGFVNPAMLNISGSSLTIDNTGPVTLSGDN
ncbi:TPA: hypothetical protein N3A33_005380, partial [Salmonella enterica subsp. salamae serovar 28:r:e,n,z15]|nr:hypothetical protein [Salmonella enterica subsp. salamae serovar 28:r:e,n,z15]